MKRVIIDSFEEIILPDPVDEVLKQFKRLISEGRLKPGDRLPSERKLEVKMKLPKGIINKAIRMMETYGIVRTVPQSGTYITSICVEALEGLMMNVISLNHDDIDSLADVRCILEQRAVKMIAENASEEALQDLLSTQNALRKKVSNKDADFDADLVFHIKLATHSGSPVLASMLSRQIVNMMTLLDRYFDHLSPEIKHDRLLDAIGEHDAIIRALLDRNANAAMDAVEQHFSNAQVFRSTHGPEV